MQIKMENQRVENEIEQLGSLNVLLAPEHSIVIHGIATKYLVNPEAHLFNPSEQDRRIRRRKNKLRAI
jgi:hypothetical protein